MTTDQPTTHEAGFFRRMPAGGTANRTPDPLLADAVADGSHALAVEDRETEIRQAIRDEASSLAQARRDLEDVKAERDEARQGESDEANAYRLRSQRSHEQAKTIERLKSDNAQLRRLFAAQAGTGDTAQPGDDETYRQQGSDWDEEMRQEQRTGDTAQLPDVQWFANTIAGFDQSWDHDGDQGLAPGYITGLAASLVEDLTSLLAPRPPLAPIEDPWTTKAGLAATKDDYPDLPTGGRPGTATECTDMRCRRIDGRCVGMHCAKCGSPCGPQGHIGGCPPDQGNGDTGRCELCLKPMADRDADVCEDCARPAPENWARRPAKEQS